MPTFSLTKPRFSCALEGLRLQDVIRAIQPSQTSLSPYGEVLFRDFLSSFESSSLSSLVLTAGVTCLIVFPNSCLFPPISHCLHVSIKTGSSRVLLSTPAFPSNTCFMLQFFFFLPVQQLICQVLPVLFCLF